MLTGRELVFETYDLLCDGGINFNLPEGVIDVFGSVRLRKGFSGVEKVNLRKIKRRTWMIGMGVINNFYDIFALHYYGNNHLKTVPRQVLSLNEQNDRFYFNLLLIKDDGGISIGEGTYQKEMLGIASEIDRFVVENKDFLLYRNCFPSFLFSKIHNILMARS